MAQLQLRNSERGAMKRCPQRWYWSIVDGLVPIRAANPLWFGAAVHDALAEWYLPGLKRGPHPAETFAKVLEGDRSFLVTSEDEEKEYVDARELGVDMLEHYVDHYGEDDSWDVIATEQTFQVWIPDPRARSRKRWLRLVGTFDGVYRDLDDGEIKLMEHKTAASGLDPGWLNLDDQAGTYWMVANSKLRSSGVLKPGESITYITYNFLRKSKRDVRPQDELGLRHNKPQKKHYIAALQGIGVQNIAGGKGSVPIEKAKIEELETACRFAQIKVLGEVSAIQPQPWFERWPVYRDQKERRTMIRRIQAEATYAEAWRAGRFEDYPLYKTPVAVGPQACKSSCPFFRMCELHEQGDSGWEEFRDTMYTRADPYAAHDRKSA